MRSKYVEWCDAVETSSAAIAEAKAHLAHLQTILHLTEQTIDASKAIVASSYAMKAQLDRLSGCKISIDAARK
jgi:hypothetical protein